ncbi:unnamed protein product [Prunus armeniaca]
MLEQKELPLKLNLRLFGTLNEPRSDALSSTPHLQALLLFHHVIVIIIIIFIVVVVGFPFDPGAYRFFKHFAFLRTKEKLQRQNPLGLATAVLKAEAEGCKKHGLKKLWLNHHVASGPHASFNEVMPLISQQTH